MYHEKNEPGMFGHGVTGAPLYTSSIVGGFDSKKNEEGQVKNNETKG